MSEIHAAVGSYVVNALDGPELSEFEAHLAVCETCRREVVEFSETANQLGSLVETPPPPALRASILSAIREVRPLPPEESRDEPEATEPTRLPVLPETTTRSGSHALSPTGSGPVDELAVRRARRASRLLTLAAAAALVVALALGGWVVSLRQDRQAQVASATLEAQLLAAPDLRVLTKPTSNGGVASFRISRSLGKAMFVGNLPDPGAGKTYQLWTIQGTAAVPDHLVGGGSDATAWLGGDITGADGAAVTIEPSGGSQQPTLPILASVAL